MSHHNYHPYQYNSDDLQFKIVSRSHQYLKAGTTMSASSSDYDHKGTHLPMADHKKLEQVIMNDTQDIFNDNIEGGGVEPSINESIRQSIQCSFVSSECGEAKQRYQDSLKNDNQRSNFVMNRMNWITYLKVLFDQLESFNQNKQKHVETSNFLKGLMKIKNLLPLMSRNEYYKNCSEVAFTFKDVEIGVTKMPQYITWDNVIDVFLSKSFATQQPGNVSQSRAFQQLNSEDTSQQPQNIDESRGSDDYFEEVDVDQSYQDRYSDNRGGKGRRQKVIVNKNSLSLGKNVNQNLNDQGINRKRNDDFFLSFADSLVHHGTIGTQDILAHQQLVAQAPILGNPKIGLKDKDDDEACEIDSDYSDEESKNNSTSRRQRSKLEESIRSSRTATFKTVRRTSTHQAQSNTHSSQLVSALSQAVNVQDSYYQTLKNSSIPQTYQSPQSMQLYYQQSIHSKQDSRNSQDHIEDGQVEVASLHSNGSQKYRTMDKGVSFKGEKNDDVQQEKSTRISSLNSAIKNININQNNTILSQDSSQSSQQTYSRQQQNISKTSSVSKNSTSMISQSNYVDMDLQGKNLKNIEIDQKTGYNDKRQLRSVNFSNNLLIKLPVGLEKTLQFMNVSYNKLKSLNGIEQCVNLKFLNVSGNMISSANSLAHLQSMRELIFAHNQLSLLKEIGQLKNLNLLDVSYNKLIEFDKLDSLLSLKKLTTLSLQGNLMHKIANYESVVQRKLPHVKVLDPDCIKDFSQFNDMEHICFSNPSVQQEFMIVDQQIAHSGNTSDFNEQQQKPRSRTPQRDRPRSQMGKPGLDQKLKSTVISPQRNIIDNQSTPKGQKKQALGNISNRPSTTAFNDYKFRLQAKYSNIEKAMQLAQNKRQIPQQQQSSSQVRDRSNTGEVPKSSEELKNQTRERSVSNISRNNKNMNLLTTSNSGRSTTQQSIANNPIQHQNTIQSVKDANQKRLTMNPNSLIKAYGSQGKITPRRNNLQTPRQEKVSNYYKKSFCTEDEQSFQQKSQEKEISTPSEKNTVRTAAQTQDSSGKKTAVRNVQKRDEIALQNAHMAILSPGGKVTKSLLAPKQALGRPITNVKQRVLAQSNEQQSNLGQQVVQMALSKLGMPQSTKNNSQSFVFEQAKNQGKSTPTNSQNPSNRPSSQLQKFITNSAKQSFTNSQQQSSSRPSTQTPGTSMSTYAIPSQKLTNLPPRAYQQKSGNPGDKKSKADMSLSMISQGTNPSKQTTNKVMNTSQNQSTSLIKPSIIQTGSGLGGEDDDGCIETPFTSRSMSPVLEESNNIKKLKVDLTQFMNKQ